MHRLVKSPLPGIKWPAIAAGINAELMSLQFQLKQSETMSEEKREALQFKQLSLLINHAASHNPFYRSLFEKHNHHVKRNYDRHSWLDIPLLTRSNLQKAGDKIQSSNVPAEHVIAGEITTSGSTGLPITVRTTQVSQLIGYALTLRDHLWHQRDLSKKLCVIKHFSDGANPPNGELNQHWGIATSALYETGQCANLSISASIAQQYDWLIKHQPCYLLTYPSNLLALIDYCENQQKSLPKIIGIRTLGEVVPNQLREKCFDTFGLAIGDVYSCQEMGFIATQCPEPNTETNPALVNYHIQSENVYVEILNEQGKPCQPGEVGRVVLTTLNNFATPLIRYDIGDYAEVGHSCSCHRTLPVIKHIKGRARNMLTYPDGSKRWPFVGSSQYRAIADIRQFQLVQHDINNIEVRLVTDSPVTNEQEEKLNGVIQKALLHPFTLTFTYHENLSRSKGGKFEDFISHVDAINKEAHD